MPKRRPSKRVTFRANKKDQETLNDLVVALAEKRMSEILRQALKELLRRVKRRGK